MSPRQFSKAETEAERAKRLKANFQRQQEKRLNERINAQLPVWVSGGTPAQTRRRIALINTFYVLIAAGLLARFLLASRGFCSSNIPDSKRSWWARCRPCPTGALCQNGKAHCGTGWVPYRGWCVKDTKEGRKEMDITQDAQQLLGAQIWYYNHGCSKRAGYTWKELGTRLVGRAAMAADENDMADAKAMLKRAYMSAASVHFGALENITASTAETETEYRSKVELAQRLSLCQLKLLLWNRYALCFALGAAGVLVLSVLGTVRQRNQNAHKVANEIAEEVWLALCKKTNNDPNVTVPELAMRREIAPNANDTMWETVIQILSNKGGQRIGFLRNGVLSKHLCIE